MLLHARSKLRQQAITPPVSPRTKGRRAWIAGIETGRRSDRIVLVQRSLKQSHVNVAQRTIQPRHCQLSQPCRLEPIASAAPCPTGGASAQLAHNAAGGRSGRAHAYERTRRALLVVAGFGVRRGVGHPTAMQAVPAFVRVDMWLAGGGAAS